MRRTHGLSSVQALWEMSEYVMLAAVWLQMAFVTGCHRLLQVATGCHRLPQVATGCHRLPQLVVTPDVST